MPGASRKSRSNRLTIGALKALWATDAQTALVGFDDFELAEMLPTPVTVIQHDATELGRQAARLVFEHLEQPPQTSREFILPVELVPRGTGERRPT